MGILWPLRGTEVRSERLEGNASHVALVGERGCGTAGFCEGVGAPLALLLDILGPGTDLRSLLLAGLLLLTIRLGRLRC